MYTMNSKMEEFMQHFLGNNASFLWHSVTRLLVCKVYSCGNGSAYLLTVTFCKIPAKRKIYWPWTSSKPTAENCREAKLGSQKGYVCFYSTQPFAVSGYLKCTFNGIILLYLLFYKMLRCIIQKQVCSLV